MKASKSTSIDPAFAPAVDHLQEVLRGIRSGRAGTGLVESLMVDYYGTQTRLKDIASLSTPDARTVQIEPWDTGAVPTIEKAISMSPIGIQPTTAGTVIRLNIPLLTEERRREMVKLAHTHQEEARIAVRNVREKILKDLKRQHENDEISEDEMMGKRNDLQTRVDAAMAALDAAVGEKETELLGT